MKQLVRSLDELRRVVIPRDYCDALGWTADSKITMVLQDEYLLLHTYENSCSACNSKENLQKFHGIHICQGCIDELKKI